MGRKKEALKKFKKAEDKFVMGQDFQDYFGSVIEEVKNSDNEICRSEEFTPDPIPIGDADLAPLQRPPWYTRLWSWLASPYRKRKARKEQDKLNAALKELWSSPPNRWGKDKFKRHGSLPIQHSERP